MRYSDVDGNERHHRTALAARRLAAHERYGRLEGDYRLADLTVDYDERLRERHDAFLNAVECGDTVINSPKLAAMMTPQLLSEVVEQVRTARKTTHATDRKGSIVTEVGRIYWAIQKPSSIREIVRSMRGEPEFRLGLWDADDVAKEVSAAGRSSQR